MSKYIIENINTINNIPDQVFTGYYWLSNKEEPELLIDAVFPKDKFGEGVNPFCIEALLYSESKGISIHIQHTGIYLVHAFDLNKLDGLKIIDKTFLPHKLENVKKVKFKQVWEDEPLIFDAEESMPTLKPTALIFCGFKYL